jgi:hypothetical protein
MVQILLPFDAETQRRRVFESSSDGSILEQHSGA